MRSDMTVVTPKSPTNEYDPDSPRQVTLYSKFFRVIELASDFLEVRLFRVSILAASVTDGLGTT